MQIWVDVTKVFYTTQVIREDLSHINVNKNCGTAKANFFLIIDSSFLIRHGLSAIMVV